MSGHKHLDIGLLESFGRCWPNPILDERIVTVPGDLGEIAIGPGLYQRGLQLRYARASGYISKRNVDIGSRVKAGDLLVEIIAPELEHQITQAESILAPPYRAIPIA